MRLAWVLPGALLGMILLSAVVLLGQSLSELRLVSPRQGAVVRGTVPIVAEATDDMEISFVIFGIDGDRPVAMNARPFVCSWDTRTCADGPHVLFVEAHGPGGLRATAGPIRVVVRNQVAWQPAPAGSPRATTVATPVTVRDRVARQPAPASYLRPTGPLPPPRASKPLVSRQGCTLIVAGSRLPAVVRLQDQQAYLQVRPVMERAGGTVSWDTQKRAATLRYNTRTVRLTVGDKIAHLNGDPVTLWRAPLLEADRIVLPARAFTQLFSFPVCWDGKGRVLELGFLAAPKQLASVAMPPR